MIYYFSILKFKIYYFTLLKYYIIYILFLYKMDCYEILSQVLLILIILIQIN